MRRDAGIVDEDVEAPECFDGSVYQTFDVRSLADVRRYRKAFASGSSNRVGNRLRYFRIPAIHRYRCTCTCQPLSDRPADASAAAGHDSNFPRQRKQCKSVHKSVKARRAEMLLTISPALGISGLAAEGAPDRDSRVFHRAGWVRVQTQDGLCPRCFHCTSIPEPLRRVSRLPTSSST